jgi:hypothetical protein
MQVKAGFVTKNKLLSQIAECLTAYIRRSSMTLGEFLSTGITVQSVWSSPSL